MPFTALLLRDESTPEPVLEGALAEAGCEDTCIAVSCDVGVELVREHRFDLVVLDVGDPHAVAMVVRAVKRHGDAPVIVITDEASIGDACEARVVEYVGKPVRYRELVARIRNALRLRSEREQRIARERSLTARIRRLEQDNHELECLACVDSLTGIANRRHVLALLAAEWKRALRDATPLSVVMLDVDEFHAFNEHYGHPGGDTALRRAAGAMVGCLRRPSDFLGRYGGEEFLAILGNTDAAGARVVADRLSATVAALRIPHDRSTHGVVTTSAGFASMQPGPSCDIDTLIGAADAALLRAKANGRDRVEGDAPPCLRIVEAPPREYPLVIVDPWYADRVPCFLEHARSDAAAARRAPDCERIRATARRLASTARDYQLDELRELAATLERCARASDRDGIQRAAEALEDHAAHVQVVYRRRTDTIAAVAP